MKRLAVACLAAVFACGSAWAVAGAQEHTNNGHHYGWRNHNRNQYGNQCNSGQYNRGNRHENDNDRDDNDDNENDNNGQYGRNGQYGNCNGQYGANASVRGQIVAVNGNQVTLAQNGGYNNGGYGQYGQNGQNGQYGQYGQYGRTITINDQPALDNQTSGRVSVGRYVTAYGYWQNGIFYATQMN